MIIKEPKWKSWIIQTTTPLFSTLLDEKDIQNGDYDIHWLEKWLEKSFK